MDKDTTCVLVSGGVDSAVLAWHVMQQGRTVQPVYIRTGMMWEEVEHTWLTRYLEAIASPDLRRVRVLDFPLADVYESHWSVGGSGAPSYDAPDEAVYLPGRNVILIGKTAVYCALNHIERIAIGVLSANPFPDATDSFFDGFGQVLSAALASPITIERPFAHLHKTEVVQLGAALPLELTFSCIRPQGELHCGDCNKCAERQQGFIRAGVDDRTKYAHLHSHA